MHRAPCGYSGLHQRTMFRWNAKPRGIAVLRASCLVVLVGVAAVVLRQNPATTTLPGSVQGALLSSSPGTLIGPAREKSVSFLVLLRSAARPTCLVQWAGSERLSVQWPAGQRWATISGAPDNVDRDPPLDRKPGSPPALSDGEIDDLIAFLNTLTDGYAAP